MASRRRHFGSVRKLPSGYWQASYWHRAARHVAPRTFPTKLEALGWLAAVETAVRQGESTGLTRGAVDLGQSTLTVDRQFGRDGRLGPPKPTAGTRTCVLPSALAVVVRAHLESLGAAVTHADQLVFAAPGGGPFDYSHWRHRVWLPAAAGVPGAGFHDLRRANATALVAAGVDSKTAQTRLGHSDPRLTLTI